MASSEERKWKAGAAKLLLCLCWKANRRQASSNGSSHGMEILERKIHKILARVSGVADFRRIASDIVRGETEASVSGLSGSARALFIVVLWQYLRRPLIIVTPQDRDVAALAM